MVELHEDLYNKRQTTARIFQLARKFSGDLDNVYTMINGGTVPLSALTLIEYFDLVKNIPYKRDIAPVEIVSRPVIIFENYLLGIGRDCKKAAVLIGSYLEKKRFLWRLAVISTRPDKKIHHVFPQADIHANGNYLNLDATYSSMKPFQKKQATAIEYIYP